MRIYINPPIVTFSIHIFKFEHLGPAAVKIHTCAPVKVAISKICVALRSFFAYATPSANTKRPSASVLLISTVRPE